jgi:hypothetical protein
MSPCKCADREAVLLERFVQIGNITLAVAEDDAVFQFRLTADQVAQAFAFSKSLLPQATNRCSAGRSPRSRRAGPPRCVPGLQELVGQLLDFRRHGGREEQRLPGERDELDDALDVRNEAHVEHPVGFVDHQKFDARQEQLAAFRVVEQAAGRGDQHIGAALKLAVCSSKETPPISRTMLRRWFLPYFSKFFVHLGGQFAGRLEDQRARHARPGAASFQHCQHRQDEGCGLAGSGLGDAENIAPFKGWRDCACLNRCWRRVAGVSYGGQYFLA